MKKIMLLLAFLCVSLLANAQATCNQTFSVSGLDNDPTVLTINATDLTCNGAGAITGLQLVNGSTPGNCAADGSSWFNFSLSIDGGAPIVGCGPDFDNIDITGFTTLTITSADTDGWAAGDDVTITIDVEVTFTPTTPPNCDAVLTSPANGETSASVGGNITWSAASGGATGYNLTVGTTSGGSDVLATTDVGNVLSYALGTLSANTQYYITIEPYNSIGVATGCTEQTFTTYDPVAGDICEIAFPINCGDSASGTTVGATSNGAPTGSCGTSSGAPGVWYSFAGNGDAVTASLCASSFDTKIQVYEGDCGALICVDGNDDSCSLQSEVSFVSEVGTQYYIYVYGFSTTGDYVLDLSCIAIDTPVSTDITTYTVDQLVTPILVDVDCANVSNINSSSHSTGSDTGIAYFTNGGGTFPFADGIVLSSGKASEAKGPYLGGVDLDGPNSGFNGPGDADLESAAGVSNTNDATFIEFDFVPLAPEISFNYIMASTEYNKDDECTFADAFAFILTHIPSGTTSNLAVLPTTDTGDFSVIVTNIHPEVPGFGGCPAVNEQYFEAYSAPFDVVGYPGRTVPLTAFSTVIPGDQYHIKLVIADQGDDILDTAVFLEGGSFALGNINLGNDVLLGDPAAICEGETTTLNAGVLPTGTFVTWYKDGVEVSGSTVVNPVTGDTEQILVIDETGDYTVEFTFNGTNCSTDDTVHIEFYPNPTPNFGENVVKCAGEEFVLDANVVNINAPGMGTLTYVWEYNGVIVQSGPESTFLIGATTVIANTSNTSETVQFVNPIDGSTVYADVVNGVYNLGDFVVTVTDDVTGCSGTDSVTVSFYENANCIDLPTGLSPNGDGINDCLVFDDIEDIEGISVFQVFDRYGTKVYEKDAYEREWCGTNSNSGEVLKTGTYYYILEYEDGREPIRSWIYINRKN